MSTETLESRGKILEGSIARELAYFKKTGKFSGFIVNRRKVCKYLSTANCSEQDALEMIAESICGDSWVYRILETIYEPVCVIVAWRAKAPDPATHY